MVVALHALLINTVPSKPTVARLSLRLSLPILLPPRSASPVLRSVLPAVPQTRNHQRHVPPRQRSVPDSNSSLALRFRRGWRHCTILGHRRTSPWGSSLSSASGSRRPS